MKNIPKKIGFIGCGNMGEAILSGMLCSKIVLSSNLVVFDALSAKRTRLKKKYKVKTVETAEKLIEKVDYIILAVKPQSLSSFESLKGHLKHRLVISVLAGTPIKKLQKVLGTSAVIRVMPNLGAFENASMSVLTKSRSVSKTQMKHALGIFKGCGEVMELPEKSFDAVTAVSGSGPAYFFLLAELLIQSAVKLGISKKKAEQLAIQTAFGAGLVMKKTSKSPEVLRVQVTSKKGTTEAALKAFRKNGFEKMIREGVKAANKRSKELGL